MKHPGAFEVIEFPSGRIMEYTQKILVAFAIALLGSLSLSSAAYIKKDFDFANNFEKNFNFELPRVLREKRHSEQIDLSVTKDNAANLEDLSEIERNHDRRAIAEKIQETTVKYEKHEEQEKRGAHEENSDTEENTQDGAASYKNVHDVIQALMSSDDEDLAEKEELQENSKLKRHLHHHIGYPAIASGILGADFLEEISLERLNAHSCEHEAFGYGHLHHSGLFVHEFFCELRKFHHYMMHGFRGLRSELTLGPLVTEEFEGDVLGSFYRHTPQLLEAIIKEPHHLLVLPEIIRDVVPFSSIFSAVHRIRHTFFKALHLVHNLLRLNFHHILQRFFIHHHFGLRLLHILRNLGHLHLLERIGLIIPEHIFTQPILSPVATYDDELYIPEYRQSFGEIISTFRGLRDGYFASGIHDLFRSGVRTFTSASTTSTITSFLSTIPFLNNFVPYLNGITTSSAASAASVSSVDVGPAVIPVYENFAPVVNPVAGFGSVVGSVAPVSASASSAASASSTVGVGGSVIGGPVINPGYGSVVGGPVIGGPVISPGYGSVVAPVEEAVSTSVSSAASASSSVGVSSPAVSPVVAAPAFGHLAGYGSVVSPVASTASSAASASSAVGVSSPAVVGGSVISPMTGYGSVVGPVATETATSSASSSASTTTTVVEAQPVIAEPVVSYVAPAVPVYASSPAVSVSETTSVSSSSSTSVSVAESAPAVVVPSIVEAVPEVVDCAPAPVVVPSAVETVTATASASASSSASDVAAVPFSNGLLGPAVAPAAASASASSSASVSTTDYLPESVPFAGHDYYPGVPLARPGFFSSLTPSRGLASAMAAATSGAVSTASSAASIISRRNFSFVLPREKFIGVLGSDCMIPGDILAVTLRNRAVLYGSVLDASSPIRFSFVRPRPFGSLLRKGARVWNVQHSDFTDSESLEIFNDPVLLGAY